MGHSPKDLGVHLEQFQANCDCLLKEGQELIEEIEHSLSSTEKAPLLTVLQKGLNLLRSGLIIPLDAQSIALERLLEEKIIAQTSTNHQKIKVKEAKKHFKHTLEQIPKLSESLSNGDSVHLDPKVKRLDPRYDRRFKVYYQPLGEQQEIETFSRDVGSRGLFILSEYLEKVGRKIILRVELPNFGTAQLGGVVVWKQWAPPELRKFRPCGFGIKITDAPKEWMEFFGIAPSPSIKPLAPHLKPSKRVTEEFGIVNEQPMKDPSEQRRMPRYEKRLAVLYTLPENDQIHAGFSKDIGPMGVHLQAEHVEEIGQMLFLTIALPNQSTIELHGVVVWRSSSDNDKNASFGVKIISAPDAWFSYFFT